MDVTISHFHNKRLINYLFDMRRYLIALLIQQNELNIKSPYTNFTSPDLDLTFILVVSRSWSLDDTYGFWSESKRFGTNDLVLNFDVFSSSLD